MRIGWRHGAALVLAGIAVAFLVALSGLIGVKASTGHWKATDWFLHWVMRSSVRTAALGTKVPDFTDGMLPMAAGHFEAGCAICHGSPALPRPESVRHMLPAPPDLKEPIPTWSDAELFQIVQHGIRFTGMPAWPVADREDEAWAMVAFLRRYPQLDADSYRRLAGFTTTQSKEMNSLIETCNGCHAPDRIGVESLIPPLAGQSATYLEQALAAYADTKRPSGIMAVAVQSLGEPDRQALARHFANQSPVAYAEEIDRSLVDQGAALARQGDATRGVPACLSCHEKPDGNPAYPRLSGLPQAYIARQLRLFVDKTRGGGPFHSLMTRAAADLEQNDIAALAAYFSARAAGPLSARP